MPPSPRELLKIRPSEMESESDFSMGSSQLNLTVVLEVTALLGYLDLDTSILMFTYSVQLLMGQGVQLLSC